MINGKQIAEMEARLDFHQNLANAYRVTIADLKGSAVAKVAKRAPATMRHAAAIDRARRKGKSAKPKVKSDKASVLARRQRTAAVLATFDREEPRPLPRGLVSVVMAGYLRKKGKGYVRTAKEFTP